MLHYKRSYILSFITAFSLIISNCREGPNTIIPGKIEKDIVKEMIAEIIIDREEKKLFGPVRSLLEYGYSEEAIVDDFVPLEGGQYQNIVADSFFEKIRDVEIEESASYLFNRSGQLIRSVNGYQSEDLFHEYEKFYSVFIENFIFSKKGILEEWNRTNFNGNFILHRSFIYDKSGRLIEVNETSLPDSNLIKWEFFYKIDTVIMEETASKNGVIHYSNVNTYDKYGESINYVPDPGEEKLFDKNGNLVKVFYPGLEGLTSAFSIAYDYDYFDRKVRETHYDSLDNITNMEMFYYDDKGGVIQADKIDKNRIATQLLAGDEYGYPIERIYLPFNDSIGSFIYNWENKDRYGNIIKQAWIQRDENGNLLEDVRTTDFTYDKMGNWINKKVFRNDTLEFIYERQIIYY